MARSRIIKPSFFTNDILGELDPLCRLFFIGLWCMADREGRIVYRAKKLKIEILPYDECNINIFIEQLSNHGFIQVYGNDNSKYIHITNWAKHQFIHPKEAQSCIPIPPPSPPSSFSSSFSISILDACDMHQSSISHASVMHEPCMNHASISKDKSTTSKLHLDGFEQFWNLYPRKTNKKTTQDKWVSKKCYLCFQTILDDIQYRFIMDHKKDPFFWLGLELKFIPLPVTYLNQERWNDEIPSNLAQEAENKLKLINQGKQGKEDEKLQTEQRRKE